MKQIFSLFILLHSFSAKAQISEEEVKIYSVKLSIALIDLDHYSNSIELRENYIRKFPGDALMFRNIFDSPSDHLYSESHKYIFKLSELWEISPKLVGKKLIRLCVELEEWEADAVGYIQHVTMQYANEKYSHFVTFIKQLNATDITTLITFLADVENHKDYLYYHQIITKLKTDGEHQIAKEFEIAREKRIKLNHH